MTLELTVAYTPDDNGTWIAEILEIEGAFSYGDTKEEARERAFEVAAEILAERRNPGGEASERERIALVA